MEPILTRYLYEKREVMHSLLLALISRQLNETLFWTYELWFSGFEEEVWDWIFCIYEEFYRTLNPRYERVLCKQYNHWKTTENDHSIIGSVVMTLNFRTSQLHLYFERMGYPISQPPKSKDPEKFVFQFTKLSKYITEEAILDKANQFLSTVRKFHVPRSYTRIFMDMADGLENLTHSVIRNAYFSENWLYYCRNTPLWQIRIAEYEGDYDDLNKQVWFPNDDMLEQFYAKYGLEPDEQSVSTHGFIEYTKTSLDKFIERYG